MSDRSFEERTGDQECEPQFMIKIKTHASAWKHVWAHVHSAYTHTWATERGEEESLWWRQHQQPHFSLQFCNSTSVPAGSCSRGQQSPIFSFQQVILNSSQQNQTIWVIRKVTLTLFLLNPLAFCGGPWHGFRHRFMQPSKTESRSCFLHTPNSSVCKNRKCQGFAQHFPSPAKSLLPL